MNDNSSSLQNAQAVAPVPVAVAYRNFLAKARECWPRTIDADPYDASVGYAQIVDRVPESLAPAVIVHVVRLMPDGDNSTRITHRGIWEFDRDNPESLGRWATGEKVKCPDHAK